MQNANRKLANLGKQMQKVGAGLTVGLTVPLTALAVSSINNFDKQAKAIAQVEAGLKSTGNQVGKTSAELQKMASDLQKTTLFGDEEILQGVTAQLLTFTNISGTAFDRTQKAALDLATRLDGDLKSSAIQLGKALNDPVANLSALSRSGIQFSTSQKETINALVQTNKLAEAQTIILDELEKQYGGSAAAAAAAGKGPLTQLSNILSDISEDFGKIILEGITPFVAKIKEIALRFQELSPGTKKWIVILGGVAAAVGPLLALAGTILPAIGAGLALLTGPVLAVIAALTAIGVVIYKNWAPIKKTLVDIANYFIDLYNESFAFRIGVEAVVAMFKTFWEIGKFVFEGLKSLLGGFVDQFTTGFKAVGDIFKAVLTGNFKELPGIIKNAAKQGANNFGDLTKNLGNDWKNLMAGIEKTAKDGLDNITKKEKIAFVEENVDASAITEAVKKAVEEGVSGGAGGIVVDDVPEAYDMADLYKGTDMAKVDAIDSATTGSFLSGMAEAVDADLTAMDENLSSWVENTETHLARLAEIGAAVGDTFGSVFEDLSGRVVESLGLASSGFEGFIKGLIGTITKLIAMMLAQSISQAIAGATASGAATGPAAVFTTPAFIATAVGGVLAAFAAIPKFATGGVVDGSSFYGDKLLARVNSGELILNKDQQKTLYNMTSSKPNEQMVFIPNAVIKGSDIVLSYERSMKQKSRTN